MKQGYARATLYDGNHGDRAAQGTKPVRRGGPHPRVKRYLARETYQTYMVPRRAVGDGTLRRAGGCRENAHKVKTTVEHSRGHAGE